MNTHIHTYSTHPHITPAEVYTARLRLRWCGRPTILMPLKSYLGSLLPVGTVTLWPGSTISAATTSPWHMSPSFGLIGAFPVPVRHTAQLAALSLRALGVGPDPDTVLLHAVVALRTAC